MAEKIRFAWLDNARLAAMIIMLFAHLSPFLDYKGLSGQYYYDYFIVSFNMPLFVILSGFGHYGGLMRLSNVGEFLQMIWKIIKTLLFPILLTQLLYCVIDRNWNMFGLETCLWFLWMLFYLMIINTVAMGIVKYISSKIGRGFGINRFDNATMQLWMSIILSIIISAFFYRMYSFEFCTYFAVGLLVRHYRIFDGAFSQWWCIILLFALSIGAYIYWMDVQSTHWFYYNGIKQMKAAGLLHHYVLRQIIAVLFSFALILSIKRISGKENWFSKMGKHTLTIYIVQDVLRYYFLDKVKTPCWGAYFGWIQVGLLVIIVVLMGVALSRLLNMCCSKIKSCKDS